MNATLPSLRGLPATGAWIIWLWLVLAWGVLPATASAQPPSLHQCDAQVRDDAGEPGALNCYLAVSRSGRVPLDGVARHLLQRLTRNPGETSARLALAHVRSLQGLPEAADLFLTAAEEYAASSNSLGAVLAHTGRASYLMRRGRVDDAAAALAPARALARASADARLLAWVNSSDAWLAYRQLDYGRALRLLEAVKETVAGTKDNDLRSVWMSARAANLWALGRPAEALAQYRDQAAFLAGIGNRYEEATALANIVLLTGGPERRTLALEAARIARESGNLTIESSAYFYLAGTSPPAEALQHAKRSLELARAARAPENISRAKGAVALYTLPANPAEAFRLIDESIEEARGVGDPNQAVRQRFIRANMRWQAGTREQALAASASLLESIEALRSLQPEEAIRAQRFAQWRYAYYRLAGHLQAGHLAPGTPTSEDLDLAFRTIERMRARLLLDRLDAAGASPRPRDQALSTTRTDVLQRVAAVNRRLATLAGSAEGRLEAMQELQRLERQAADIGAEIARSDPSFGDALMPRPAGLAEVRRALRPDEALISFQVAALTDDAGPFGAWVWTITRDSARSEPLRHDNALTSAIDVFLGLIQRRDGSDAVAAERLYADLLAQAIASLPSNVTRLVIVPDGPLHRLPFDALRERAAGPPVGSTFALSIVPSASIWLRWRQQVPEPAARAALILADPALERQSAAPSGERAAFGELSRLPEARREGRAVARALGDPSQMFSGTEATETLVKRAPLGAYRVLHFAAHAVIDDEHPERSAVVLTAGGAGGEDGYLQVHEIVDLPLSGQLVLLSACRSAGGALVPGEGALGLAHGFFRAGARTVVATLWAVRDDDSAAAFTLIAAALGRGENVAVAVASARRELSARGLPAAAWAGLVVMGDGELVPFPGGRYTQPAWWLLASAACASAAVAAWIVRRRRTSRVQASPALSAH